MTVEPLLMLCGIGGDADSWRDQAEALGGTPLVAEGDTVEAMAAWVLEQAPPRFALAGQSMGGYVALAIAVMAPERISRLALINTSAAPDTEAQKAFRLRSIATVEREGLGPMIDQLPQTLTADIDVQRRLANMLRRATPERIIREHRACAARPDRRPDLPSIALPTLVIGTADDVVIRVEAVAEMAGLLPDAEHILIPDGGHASPMARPERITPLLRQWLG